MLARGAGLGPTAARAGARAGVRNPHAAELERLERAAVEVGGVLVGESLAGAARRSRRVVGGAHGVRRRPGLEQVVGELAEVAIEGAGVDVLERLGDLGMDGGPAARRDLGVQGLLDEAWANV